MRHSKITTENSVIKQWERMNRKKARENNYKESQEKIIINNSKRERVEVKEDSTRK